MSTLSPLLRQMDCIWHIPIFELPINNELAPISLLCQKIHLRPSVGKVGGLRERALLF